MKKNIIVEMNKVLPVSDKFIVDLLKADTVNNRIFYYMEEEGGEGYSTDMWRGFYESYQSYPDALPLAEEVYGGIIIRPLGSDDVEAVLLKK